MIVSDKKNILGIIIAFVLSRFIFYLAGIRFDMNTIYYFAQVIDIDLIETDFLRSLFYYHSQPPLFNLFLGTIYKIFHQNSLYVFSVIYKIIGLFLYLLLYKNMQLLGIRSKIAFYVTCFFMITPAAIYYENWLFYTYPVIMFLLAGLWSVIKFSKLQQTKFLIVLFGSMLCINLMRSMFHPVWFIVIVISLGLFFIKDFKRILLFASIVFIIMISVSLKNYILFGSFSQSTWLGMSLGKMSVMAIEDSERQILYEKGIISDVSLVYPYSSLDKYDRKYYADKTGIPILDRETKFNDSYNFNNPAYIVISDQYKKDFLSIFKWNPIIYIKKVSESLFVYHLSACDNGFFQRNVKQIKHYDAFFNRVIFGQYFSGIKNFTPRTLRVKDKPIYAFKYVRFHILLFSLISYIGIIAFIWRFFKNRIENPAAWCYVILNILYVVVLSNMVEIGENNRFRFLITPLMIIIAVKFIQDWRDKRKLRKIK